MRSTFLICYAVMRRRRRESAAHQRMNTMLRAYVPIQRILRCKLDTTNNTYRPPALIPCYRYALFVLPCAADGFKYKYV